MRRMQGARIVVAGAGAVGSTIAYTLARAGHAVTVVDPMAANASSVAAGMLAPAFACVFDAQSASHFGLLADARDLWPALAAEIGLALAREGALAIGSAPEARGWTDQLSGLGAEGRLLAPHDVRALAPGLSGDVWAAFTPEDWRLDPAAALARLRDAAQACGARFVGGRVTGFDAGGVSVAGAEDVPAERLVVATGAGRDLADLAPELTSLTPIKGHILRAEGAFRAQPVVRARGAYLCTAEGEAILGATMEAGRADSTVDPAVVEQLIAAAAPLTAALGPIRWRAAAGVRAATLDGLPLAGEGRRGGVILAVGARRNGWLLAPLIAGAVLDVVEGRGLSGAAARFDPRRVATQPG
jgi:glycine oxidase